MTKIEFDNLTKENWGSKSMASDEREGYRRRRGHLPMFDDFLARRARERLEHLPTLAIGQKWRNVAVYRRTRGLPMLRSMTPLWLAEAYAEHRELAVKQILPALFARYAFTAERPS